MENFWNFVKKYLVAPLIVILIIGGVGSGIWCLFFLQSVDVHELGFMYNRISGKIEVVKHNGWIIAAPWKSEVHKIDLRPYQVSISANQRVLNAKLVKFNPAGLDTFIQWHGRSAGDRLENLKEILKSYAFDPSEGRDCPFLTVVSGFAPGQTPQQEVRVGR